MQSDFFRNFGFLGVFFKFEIFKFFLCIPQLISLYKKDGSRKKEQKMQSDFFRNFDFLGVFSNFKFLNFFLHFTAHIIIQKR